MVISPTIKAELEEVEQISKTLRDKGGFWIDGLKMSKISNIDLKRFSRQIILKNVGVYIRKNFKV